MWHCKYCKADFEEPDRVGPDALHDPSTVSLVCPECGEDDVEELPDCVKCGWPIGPEEHAYGGMCPDCFKAWVLDLLKTSPQIVAEKLGVE